MILSDVDINNELKSGNLKIQGITKDTIRENGVDLTVAETYSVEEDYIAGEIIPCSSIIDIHDQPQDRFKKVKAVNGKIIIEPLESILIATQEFIELPANIEAKCCIRSTFARSGIMINPTVADCGFPGVLTIRITNVSKRTLIIHVGDRFLHLILEYTKTPCSKPYSGAYQNSKEVQQPKKSVQ